MELWDPELSPGGGEGWSSDIYWYCGRGEAVGGLESVKAQINVFNPFNGAHSAQFNPDIWQQTLSIVRGIILLVVFYPPMY